MMEGRKERHFMMKDHNGNMRQWIGVPEEVAKDISMLVKSKNLQDAERDGEVAMQALSEKHPHLLYERDVNFAPLQIG
jgi:hypothetical protein